MGRLVCFALLASAPAAAQLSQASNLPYPRANELFERDWVLMDWALRKFDSNHDGILSPAEAQPAAFAFKRIADGDGDGRVTPYEYGRAREYILARF
jgi:hypothetical protein